MLNGSVVNVDNLVVGINGNKVIPYLAGVRNNKTFKEILFDVNAWAEAPDTFTIDLSNEDKGYYSFAMSYLVDGNLVQLIYMINNQ